MARFLLRLEARKLRKKGVSVKKIARLLNIPRTTTSGWVRDIVLSVEQMESLRQSSIKGAELGRLRSAFIKREGRLKSLESFVLSGINTISVLSDRELLIAGLALYAGEGSKKSRRVEFCNSDPRMIKFLIRWLKICFSVNTEDIGCVLGINEIHSGREEIVRLYWSDLTEIPLDQFRKTNFKKVTNKKVYENFDNHYGTLTLRVAKSAILYYKIMGLLMAMYGDVDKESINGSVAQW